MVNRPIYALLNADRPRQVFDSRGQIGVITNGGRLHTRARYSAVLGWVREWVAPFRKGVRRYQPRKILAISCAKWGILGQNCTLSDVT